MALGGGACGRWSGHQGRALINWISALIMAATELAGSSMRGHSKKAAICNLEEGPHRVWPRWHPDLIPSLQNHEKQMSGVFKPPSLWCSVVTAQTD